TPNGNPLGTGSPGCEDGACCDLVCAQDPFCCDTTYDAICQAEGRGLCTGDPTIGCDLGITGCFDMTVEDCTALGGINIGPDCGGGGGGPCGNPCSGLCRSTPDGNPLGTGSPGCEDGACCDLVCAQDPFCCDTTYDAICQAEGRGLCTGDPTVACDLGFTACYGRAGEDCTARGGINIGPDCGGGGGGPCGNPGSGLCISTPDGNPVTTGTPGCEDAACCELVCAQDPFCCDTTYDSFCQAEGRGLCTGDPTVPCDVGF